jgi:micrococcal nuclease
MGRLAATLAIVALAALGGWQAADLSRSGARGWSGRVTRVVDGDTIHVAVEGGERIVRVIGVDTPEIAHPDRPGACFGPEAAAFTRRLLDGRRVDLEPGAERVDRYGRSLAAVSVRDGPGAGRDLATALAAAGMARPLPIPPNTANAAAVSALVARARSSGAGLWSACTFATAFPGKRP